MPWRLLSEHTYAALIHALAIKRKRTEAASVLDAMLSDEYDDGIKPGASCFAACMLSAMQERDWERVLDLDRKMIDAGLPPDPVSFHGVILASCRLKRSVRAAEAIEAAVDAELPMNREEFDLCAGLLLPTISDDAGDLSLLHLTSHLTQCLLFEQLHALATPKRTYLRRPHPCPGDHAEEDRGRRRSRRDALR